MKNFYKESLYRNLGARINRPRPPLISFKELATLLGVSEAALGGKLSRVGAPKPVLTNSNIASGSGRNSWYQKRQFIKWWNFVQLEDRKILLTGGLK